MGDRKIDHWIQNRPKITSGLSTGAFSNRPLNGFKSASSLSYIVGDVNDLTDHLEGMLLVLRYLDRLVVLIIAQE